MTLDELYQEFNRRIKQVEEVGEWLGRIRDEPVVVTLGAGGLVSLLEAAADYLSTNLAWLRERCALR